MMDYIECESFLLCAYTKSKVLNTKGPSHVFCCDNLITAHSKVFNYIRALTSHILYKHIH